MSFQSTPMSISLDNTAGNISLEYNISDYWDSFIAEDQTMEKKEAVYLGGVFDKLFQRKMLLPKKISSYVDLGVLKTEFPFIFMHPSELIKTPFGRVCLVKPYEYSEMSEPIDRLLDDQPSSTLKLEFRVDVVERLKGFEINQYLPGILSLCEVRLNKYGIYARMIGQSVLLPCSYKDVVLSQFFIQETLKEFEMSAIWTDVEFQKGSEQFLVYEGPYRAFEGLNIGDIPRSEANAFSTSTPVDKISKLNQFLL